jgi:outer membrane protein TolC
LIKVANGGLEVVEAQHLNQRLAVAAGAAILVLAVATAAPARGEGSGGGYATAPAESVASVLETPVEDWAGADLPSGLAGYLKLAIKRSPGLRAAFYEWKAALERSGYAGSPPDPVLSYGHFIENVETRVGPQERRLSVRQSYPWFGTLGAKEEMASEEANAAYQRFESERLRLFYRLKSAYYDYYYLGRDLALTRENLELVVFWESVARTKFKAALTRHPDVIRAQVELGKLEDRLLTLERNIEPAAAGLRALLDLPPSVRIPVPESLSVVEAGLDGVVVKDHALAYNPDLKSLRHLIGKAEAGVRLAKKSYFPDLTFGLDYIETGEALNPALPESGKDAWAVGVGVTLPIWVGKNNAKKQEALAIRKEAEYGLREAKNRLEAVTEAVVFEHNDALRKLKLYRDGLVPKAEQSLNANYAAYQAGELDFLNVLDAQRQLLSFQLEQERALADLAVKQAEVEMITGRELKELVR